MPPGSIPFPTPFSPEGLILKKSPFLGRGCLVPRRDVLRAGRSLPNHRSSSGPHARRAGVGRLRRPGGKIHPSGPAHGRIGEKSSPWTFTRPKVEVIQENCRRLGITTIQTFPPMRPSLSLSLPDVTFDRILLDAPCTGLGILHRNPEVKWRRKPQDPRRLQGLQMALLENVCSRLKTEGVLVYSTCTMTREENDSVVEAFLGRHKDFQVEDLRSIVPESWQPLIDERGFLRTYPEMIILKEDYRLDGFLPRG